MGQGVAGVDSNMSNILKNIPKFGQSQVPEGSWQWASKVPPLYQTRYKASVIPAQYEALEYLACQVLIRNGL